MPQNRLHHHRLRHGNAGFTLLALTWARNLYAALDRRMPEATALTQWLLEYRMSLGLGQEGMTEEACYDLRCGGIVTGTWRRIGTRLAAGSASIRDVTPRFAACAGTTKFFHLPATG